MTWWSKSKTAISFLPICASSLMRALATNGLDKRCLPPKATYTPQPPPSHYPLTESAHTILYIGVDEQGRVTKSSGSPDFDRDAMSTVQRWRFKSATCDGKPVSTRINIDIESNVRK